jgi:hypothetical protein
MDWIGAKFTDYLQGNLLKSTLHYASKLKNLSDSFVNNFSSVFSQNLSSCMDILQHLNETFKVLWRIDIALCAHILVS